MLSSSSIFSATTRVIVNILGEMRRSLKAKADDKAKTDESENGDASDEEVSARPASPASSTPKTKRRSKGKVAGPRSKRRKDEEDDVESKASVDKDDGSNSEEEETASPPKKSKAGGKGKKPAGGIKDESVEKDDGSNSEEEETASPPKKSRAGGKGKKSAGGIKDEDDDKSDVSGDEEIPLSKKMKAVKKVPAKNGLTKGKRRAAELEETVEYEVESVVGFRLQRGKRQFRIRWKGFKEEDDTWESEECLQCAEAMTKYLQDHPEDNAHSKGSKAVKSKKADIRTKAGNKEKNGQDEDEDSEEEVTKEEYEVEQIKDVFIKKGGKREFLIRWKGYAAKDDTWEPEEHLNCGDLIKKFEEKVDKAKSVTAKELRVSRKPTDRFTLTMLSHGRRVSRRGGGKQRVRYDDAE